MNEKKASLNSSFLDEVKDADPEVVYDLLVLGGGPAAMSAVIYAARKMLRLAIITLDFGGQVRETSEVENWLGFQAINAMDLADMFEEHVKSFDISVSLAVSATKVLKEGDVFKVQSDDGNTYSGKALIFATGMRHRPLNVPGEKELVGRGVAYCSTCDAPLFSGKKVVVVGGGNSAFTTVADLLKVDAQVILVNFEKGWQADEVLQKRIKKTEKVRFMDYSQVLRINGKDTVEAVWVQRRDDDKEEKLEVEGVFVEIGLLPNNESVKELVELNANGEVIIDCGCQTSLDGFFGAGDVTTVPHKQIIIAAGEGSKAALSAYDYLISKSFV
jgi:alkyl hydroperoxide reductase subunit F